MYDDSGYYYAVPVGSDTLHSPALDRKIKPYLIKSTIRWVVKNYVVILFLFRIFLTGACVLL